jgi:DNA-binding SARP family transcriptional activator/ABC-type branched-subunit amino acid transport system substrate-binding protein/streptogramin lyase
MVEFRILGPLEVVERDKSVVLGGPRQRALLAVLLLHRGQAVSTDRLIDEVWGERPPATAAKAVQVNVSSLRKALGDGLLVTRGHGYLLQPELGQVDLDRFESLAAEGRDALTNGDAARASDRLREALALWRGPPLADFAYEPFAQGETARLEEERLAALEDRIDADLGLGRDSALVGELEALVRQHPLRERLQGQLMLALYRSGRQADALERYQQARRRLIDELGIEPGPPLKELEAAILAHDPSLRAPRHGRLVDGVLPGRTRLIIAVGAALLAVAAIAAAVLASLGSRRAGLPSLEPNSLGLIDPSTGDIRAALAIAGTPARLQASGRRVWVTSDDARTVSLIDAGTPSIASVVAIGAFPSDFAVGDGGVWVIDRVTRRLVEISPDYPTVVRSVAIGFANVESTTDDRSQIDPWSLAAGAGGVWITDGSPLLLRVDPSSAGVVGRFDLHAPLNGVAVGEGAVWVISGPTTSVLRIDPQSGRVTARIPIVAQAGSRSPFPIAIATGLGSVWVLNATAASVTRIDPVQGGVTATIPIGIERVPQRLAVGDGAAWIADADGTLTRIDATTNATTTTAVAPSLYDVGVGAGGVWVTSGSQIAGGGLAAATPSGGQAQALPASQCSPIYSGPGSRPRYLITSDLPLGGPGFLFDATAQLEQAIVFELRERGFRAGRFAIGYQACDDWASPASAGSAAGVWARCAPNMRAYAADPSVLGVIGPFNSPCASQQIAIANRAPLGPLAMISPSTTVVGLTHQAPGSQPGEPGIYYPTSTRNFARLISSDDIQGAADALLARQLGLRRVFVAHGQPDPYVIGITQSFAATAQRLGVGVAGEAGWWGPPPAGAAHRLPTVDPLMSAVATIARTIARTHPDGIFLSGYESDPAVAPLIRQLRSVMPNVQLIAPDGFAFFPQLVHDVGPAVEGMTVSEPELAPSQLPGSGQQFFAQFGKQVGGIFYPTTAYGAQATDVLLDAIARSNGTRASVTRALFASHVHDGIIGSFAFTSTGDTTVGSVTIIRIEDGQPVPWRVIRSPATTGSGG